MHNKIKFVDQNDLYTATEEIWTKAKETFSGPSVVLTTGTSTEAVMSLNAVTNHIEDTDIHVTAAEKDAWNAIPSIWTGTLVLYDAIATKDSDTIYIITSTS